MAFNIVKHRRGTTQEWLDIDIVPEDGELVIEECRNGTRKCKIGNGVTRFTKLPYINDELQVKLLGELDALEGSFGTRLEQTKEAILEQVTNAKQVLSDDIVASANNLVTQFRQEDANVKETLTSDLGKAKEAIQTKYQEDFNSLHTELTLKVADAEDAFTKAIKNEVEKLTVDIDSATETLAIDTEAKITAVADKAAKDLEREKIAREAQVEQLSDNIKALEGSVNEIVRPEVEQIDDKFTNALQNLSDKHNADLAGIIANLEDTNATLDKKIDDQAVSFTENLSEVASELSKTFNTSLEDTKQSLQGLIDSNATLCANELAAVKTETKSAIADTKVDWEAKLTAAKEELKKADDTLTSIINTMSEQGQKFSAETLTELAAIHENIKYLTEEDLELSSRISNVDTAVITLSKELSNELIDLNQKQGTGFEHLAAEVSLLEDAQKTLDLSIINTMLEYIRKIYVEIADLVDDDVTILRRLFVAENKLTDKLSKTDARISTDIQNTGAELSQNINAAKQEFNTKQEELKELLVTSLETVSQTLTANIETLRSTSNMNIRNNQVAIEKLSQEVRNNEDSSNSRFEGLESDVNANKEAASRAITEVTNRVDVLDTKLDTTHKKIDAQAERISRIVAVQHGSTSGDIELMEIRQGYNGIDYPSAKDAVQAIGFELAELKNSLPDKAIDGLYYDTDTSELYLTSKKEPVGSPVVIVSGSGGGPGGGGSTSIVRVQNNLPVTSFTVAKGNEAKINFTYTSFENEVTTGDGTYFVTINSRRIDALSGNVQHNIAKELNVSEYLKTGANTVKITCTDQYGTSRSLVYTISVVELRIESSFNSAQIFNDAITFRYKVFGKIDKTVYVLLDGKEMPKKELKASISGNEITLLIPKQTHGCHKITAFVSAVIDDREIRSNTLEYEVICTEADNNAAIITSIYNIEEVTQGDLVSIPYMIYDPVQISSEVDFIIYSQVAGELIEIDRSTLTVSREQQFWNTRKYPVGTAVFTISYTYNLYGVQTTITRAHTLNVVELKTDVLPEEDSLQLYLTAQGRSNNESDPAVWTFTQTPNGDKVYDTITTAFEGFNWSSNGWIPDAAGDTCLRLNGDARAVINFKPFKDDFKTSGKTLEFEFVVRDVNDRDAVVIDCFDGTRGFRATPDTAFLRSSGTEVACRYKDEERIRVAITVEHSETTSRFVSIYLDGVLSGIQRYADTDIFSQNNPLTITLGSSLCGLDVYSIRIYDKALSTPAVLTNYIADQTVPAVRQQLVTDNDILDANGAVSYDRVKALGQIPIITFTGPMPTYKGDKKKGTTRMKFEDPIHPEMNFDVLLDQIDVQGTSSQFYIRKNWKVKLPEARAHMPGAIPAKVYCIKVDYAEATGTHNTGIANYVETLYDREKVVLPPQKDDTRVRTTIQGFPIIIFEKETEDSEPVFSSKGNFNYDKDAENAFGFTDEYKDYGVECWEFCNNTSDPVNFAGEITADWLDDFEPRYAPKSANFERIEELKEIEELAASGKGIMTEAQRNELATLMSNCIANFKEMHDWVLSTATYTLVDGKKVAIAPTALAEDVKYGEITYTEDNEEYRLAKFKYEFKNYFNMHYSSMYYVFTFFALMTDQRAKNLFLTRWKEADGVYRWYPYFYDNDTIFGINNEGALVFDYFHEDTDQLGSSNVFNGQNSVLWNNFRLCFPQEIQATYAKLRSDKKLTYSTIINQFVTEGSDKWSAAIYNADADYKYVSMAREHVAHKDEDGNEVTGIDASNLYQVRGPGEHHLRYFIDNRINYCDSKWYAGNYPSDDIFLRIYTPKAADDATQEEIDRINASLAIVPANPNITITPFSDMYAGVRYKSGTLQQQRLKAGEPFTFRPLNENETFGDTETAIYGAGEISSLGDLSGLYCGVINLSNATKLTELTIGNANSAYYNDNFREISVGSNRLLRSIDLRNCSGLGIAGENPQKTLDLSGCPNVEHIYTEGTNLEAIALPESGYVKTLHLPASINTFVIKNQHYLYHQSGEPGTDSFRDGLFITDYKNIRTLGIENCPNLNTNEILENCRDNSGKYTVERVRLTNIVWGSPEEPLENADFVKSLFPRFDAEGNLIGGIRGIDEKNNPLEDAYLVGTCYIAKLTGEEYSEINSHYPYLDIKFGEMTSNITFKYTDIAGNELVHTESITSKDSTLGTCQAPQLDPPPAWLDNVAFTYEHAGWSRKKQVSKGKDDNENDYLEYIQADALLNIAGDRTLYPIFKAIRKKYPVTFKNTTAPEGSQILEIVDTPYDSTAEYSKNTPIKLDSSSPDLYEFVGWFSPDGQLDKITGPITFYAQFAVKDENRLPDGEDDGDDLPGYTIGWLDITNCVDYNGNVFDGYNLNDSDQTMAITECNNNFNIAVRVPETLTLDNTTYTVVKLGGFREHHKLELLFLPNTLTELSANALASCTNLMELELPESLQTIRAAALQGCTRLTELTIPANVTMIEDSAMSHCTSLEKITIDSNNTAFKVNQDCLIDIKNKKLIQGLATGTIPSDGSVTTLGQYCFAGMPITSMEIPEGISRVANNAFSRCTSLEEVILPSSIKVLEATCFAWCYKLSKVNLPEGLTDIMTYVFDSCALSDVTIPASVNNILTRSFGDMASLEKVTFTRDLDGNVRIPNIHYEAFINSGPIDFIIPWSENQHYQQFTGKYEKNDVQYDKDIFFGASIGSKLKFIDIDDNNKVVAELEKTEWGVQRNNV